MFPHSCMAISVVPWTEKSYSLVSTALGAVITCVQQVVTAKCLNMKEKNVLLNISDMGTSSRYREDPSN